MMTLLVVEDNAHIRDLTVRALQAEGYTVTQAADGDAARRLMSERVFDVLVTDVMVPGATGIDLIAHLKAHHAETRIIVVSAIAQETALTDDEMRKKLGVDVFLSKPCKVEGLLHALRRLLRRPALPADQPLNDG